MGLLDKLTKKSTCDICGTSVNKLLMQVLVDGRICNDCFNKLGKGKYSTKYTVEEAKQKIKFSSIKGNYSLKYNHFPPYGSIEQEEMDKRKAKYHLSKRYHQLTELYYKDLPSIDTQWSVLYNLKEFHGDYAHSYEELCRKNISIFKTIYEEFCIPYDTIEFTCVPAYKRLSMLYEKQHKYYDAALVCLDAIQHGVPNEYGDGNSGKMYSRLARLAKKANILNNDDIKVLLSDSYKN